jgi:hypothetical protein
MIPPIYIEDLLEIKVENPFRVGHDVPSTPWCAHGARRIETMIWARMIFPIIEAG